MGRFLDDCWARRGVCLSVMLGAVGLALVMGGCAVTEAQTQVEVADVESIASLPIERRVCRIYFGPVTVKVHSKGQWLPVAPLQGRTPEEFADIVADMGTEVWDLARFAIDGKASWALPDERRMIMVFVNISDQPVAATVHFDAAAYGIEADSVKWRSPRRS